MAEECLKSLLFLIYTPTMFTSILSVNASSIFMYKFHGQTRGKVLSWEYRSPRKRNLLPPASVILCWVSWVENVLLIYWFVGLFSLQIGLFTLEKNRRFTAFLDSKIHTQLAIVAANELGLAFPPRNLPKKFRPDPSTFYLVILVTDKQTIVCRWCHNPRESFRGDNYLPFCIFTLSNTPTVVHKMPASTGNRLRPYGSLWCDWMTRIL